MKSRPVDCFNHLVEASFEVATWLRLDWNLVPVSCVDVPFPREEFYWSLPVLTGQRKEYIQARADRNRPITWTVRFLPTCFSHRRASRHVIVSLLNHQEIQLDLPKFSFDYTMKDGLHYHLRTKSLS